MNETECGLSGTSTEELVREVRGGSLGGGGNPLSEVPGLSFRCTRAAEIAENTAEVQAYVNALVTRAESMPRHLDSLQEIKDIRASLTKEFTKMEQSRKKVKAQVMAPYEAANALYKERIAKPFADADRHLKELVDSITEEKKAACREKLEIHFEKCKKSYGIPWLNFNQMEISIDMASARAETPTRLYKEILKFFDDVSTVLSSFSVLEYKEEVELEYRKDLNAQRAVKEVYERHRALDAVAETQKQRKLQEVKNNEVRRIAKPEQYTATFTVTGTIEQLRLIRNAMDGLGVAYQED